MARAVSMTPRRPSSKSSALARIFRQCLRQSSSFVTPSGIFIFYASRVLTPNRVNVSFQVEEQSGRRALLRSAMSSSASSWPTETLTRPTERVDHNFSIDAYRTIFLPCPTTSPRRTNPSFSATRIDARFNGSISATTSCKRSVAKACCNTAVAASVAMPAPHAFRGKRHPISISGPTASDGIRRTHPRKSAASFRLPIVQ